MKRLRAYKPREDADHRAHHCKLDEAAARLG